jgi:NAD(P)-dependent dehydrogenase (short-subunit alcohol dehydrogenase family)
VATDFAGKTALEAHTINLAAELRGTGVTVNAYRPGGVDTAMQAWIRQQDPERIGADLHERFNRTYTGGSLITPEHSAAALRQGCRWRERPVQVERQYLAAVRCGCRAACRASHW